MDDPRGLPGGHSEQPTRRHTLGPHVVGQRVVVRRLLPGQTGPSSGPAMTDVLGVCESWTDGVASIRREDGELVGIRTAEIVSGKPVPPRASRFRRLSAAEVARRTADHLRPGLSEPVGDWLLRFHGGRTRRANSALLVGDPGLGFDEAIERVRAFYAGHGRPAVAQVIVGGEQERRLREAGWLEPPPGDGATDVLLASVARLRRALAAHSPAPDHDVRRCETLELDWMAADRQHDYESARALLETDQVVFAMLERDGTRLARGRASYADGWVGLSDLLVSPEHRRLGLARAILADLLDWAAEQGASTAVGQVPAGDAGARALYDGLGFEHHHTHTYLHPQLPSR